jgi:hypothetical protein
MNRWQFDTLVGAKMTDTEFMQYVRVSGEEEKNLRKWRAKDNIRIRSLVGEHITENPLLAKQARENRIKDLTEMKSALEIYGNQSLPGTVAKVVLQKQLDVVNAEILRFKLKDQFKRESKITPEMIQHAKQHPIENLVGHVNRAGFTLCLFHEEKTPSMKIKGNVARCFGSCNKAWDTIGIAMMIYGLTFPEAVRKLQ